MASRNLSQKFFELRSQFAHIRLQSQNYHHSVDSQHQKLLEDKSNTIVDINLVKESKLPPIWVDTLEGINADISLISKNLNTLVNLHSERLKVSFDSDNDVSDYNITKVSNEISSKLTHCQSLLKAIGIGATNSSSTNDRVIRLNVMRSVGKRISDLFANFRSIQSDFVNKLDKQQQLDIVDNNESNIEVTDLQNDEYNNLQLSLNKSRTDEIVKIVKNVNELQSIFSEIGVLVLEQGSLLDRIDYNIELSLTNVRKGNQDIIKAEEYQRSSRSLICILVLLVIDIILIIVLIYKHKKD